LVPYYLSSKLHTFIAIKHGIIEISSSKISDIYILNMCSNYKFVGYPAKSIVRYNEKLLILFISDPQLLNNKVRKNNSLLF